MPFPAAAIANEFLKFAKSDAKPVTPLHMQKFVYFAHGWYLALQNDPLIKERIYAWDYGPVIPSLYHELKQYGSDPITSFVKDIKIETVDGAPKAVFAETWIDDAPFSEDEEKRNARAFVERIWKVYGDFTAIQLSRLTHAEDSPWSMARRQGNTVIPDELIKEYFQRQVDANGQPEPDSA